MRFSVARALLAHTLPILIAQLASIGMMVVDTVVLGHVGSDDLAAVAIGGGLHISLLFALIGVVQAVGPLAARQHGAGENEALPVLLQQSIWLALLLSLPGVMLLLLPDPLLMLVDVPLAVADKVRRYLACLAFGVPAALIYRALHAFCNALGRPRVLMVIGVLALLLHTLLAWGLATQPWWAGRALGVLGCALSNVVISWLAMLAAIAYLQWGPLASLRLFAAWQHPSWIYWRPMLRLGVPMGVSNFVEITAFTLVSLLVSPLGADVVGAHRISANLSALAYMLPLSLGMATLSAVGRAVGARDWGSAREIVRAALCLAGASSILLGMGMWLGRDWLVAGYTDVLDIRLAAAALIGYIAIYQFFDALQTIAGQALRAYHVTFLPMLIQMLCFWGVGLFGGWWFCFRWQPVMGVAGFWLAAVLSLILAAGLLLPLLGRVIRPLETSP